MTAGSRFLATILAWTAWIIAGLSVASGPLAKQAITPTVPGAAVTAAAPTLK